MSIVNRARPEILAMTAYKSARSLHKSAAGTIFLDANECFYEPYIGAEGLSHYPDKQPREMVDALTKLYDVSSRNMIISRGADEAIDLLVKAFCAPGQDNIIICPPTFPMYAQAAIVQNAEIRKAPLTASFDLDVDAVKKQADENTKIVFLCSPNNPTANLMDQDDMLAIVEYFKDKALVVVDETYIEYANRKSLIPLIDKHENLVILRTLSKAYAAAGLRCGVAIANADVIAIIDKVLAPYPLPQPVAREVAKILEPANKNYLDRKRQELLESKAFLIDELSKRLDIKVYPSDTNFLLIKVRDANQFEKQCRDAGIIIRNQTHNPGLENCVRFSFGTRDQMQRLLDVIDGKVTTPAKDQRTATINRKTKETSIAVSVNLDQTSPVKIHTGIGFYDHMLEQIARHGGFSLLLECEGDLHIDPHHTVEDCAIALGQALKEALGDKRGIGRYGFLMPMDESLAYVALDLSGRFHLEFEGEFPVDFVGDLPTDMVEHVFRSLAENLAATCHMKVKGDNAHHMVEGCFKGFARALGQAIRREQGSEALPSTKGLL